MKNAWFKIIAFLAVLILPGFVWFAIGIVSPETKAKLDFDLGEKRAKTEIESLSELRDSGDLISLYVSDRTPFRSVLYTWYQAVDNDLEAPYRDTIMPELAKVLYPSGSGNKGPDVDDDAYNSLFGGDDDRDDGQDYNYVEPERDYHKFVIKEELESTCTMAGRILYVCSDCGEEYIQNTPVKDHNLIYAGETAASYTEWGKTIYFCSECSKVFCEINEAKYIDDSYFAPIEKDSVIVGRYNWLFYAGENSLDYYKGTNILSDDEMQKYADTLGRLQEICDEKGIKLAVTIIPDKEQVYPEYMPSYTVENEYKRVPRLVDYIQNKTNVSISYPLDELKVAGRYFDTYQPCDTHWTYAGAYVGVMGLYKQLGMTVYDPLNQGIGSREEENLGDLISRGGFKQSDFPTLTMYYIDYKMDVAVSGPDADKNVPVYVGTSDAPGGKKLFFIGDSFRVYMTDYLSKDFSEYCIVHRDNFYEAKDFVEGSDVIIIETVERYDSSLILMAEYLISALED